ncbi:MAG: hypothetical protein CYG59_03125 [Chloroflexi bacterium]|nr:MAG: hypothetical protein CYG59_03125 [Chloroflexota bacterium]
MFHIEDHFNTRATSAWRFWSMCNGYTASTEAYRGVDIVTHAFATATLCAWFSSMACVANISVLLLRLAYSTTHLTLNVAKWTLLPALSYSLGALNTQTCICCNRMLHLIAASAPL